MPRTHTERIERVLNNMSAPFGTLKKHNKSDGETIPALMEGWNTSGLELNGDVVQDLSCQVHAEAGTIHIVGTFVAILRVLVGHNCKTMHNGRCFAAGCERGLVTIVALLEASHNTGNTDENI